MARGVFCLVSDRLRLSPGADAVDRLVQVVGAAARAGVDLIQIRERDLPAAELRALVDRCVAAVDGTRSSVVVNDRADVAAAARAHGVHLRSDSMPAAAVRSLFPGEIRVGRSVHSAAEAAAIARAGGIDYLIFGTMFPTRSKEQSNPLATLDELALVCRSVAGLKTGTTTDERSADLQVGMPVLAIGGLTVERASVVARAGAAGVAGIGLFIPPRSQDPDRYFQLLVRDLRRAFDTCGVVP